MASHINDEEFGTITVRRNARATTIRLRITPDGRLRASLPLYAPLFLVKRLVKSSRADLRKLLNDHQKDMIFSDGMQIGKSHSLIVRPTSTANPAATRHGQQIIVQMPEGFSLDHPAVIKSIRLAVQQALRIEAKSYLPKRLAFLADKHGFVYEKVRFSHAGGRWGSCSSNGTISLNIALMKLPFELIDYVLIHELSHTVELNHSSDFWQLVEQGDPNFKDHRQRLRAESPSI